MAIPSLNTFKCVGKPASVYILIDPRDQTAFYVGVTTQRLCNRLGGHVKDSRGGMFGPRYDKIRDILSSGHRPIIVDVETVPFEDWVEAEQFWIANFRFLGAELTNLAVGGPGALGTKQSTETRALMSKVATGRDMSPCHAPEARALAASKTRRPIKLDGIIYEGVAVASRATGVPCSTLQDWLDIGKAKRLYTRRGDKPRIRKGGFPRGAAHHNSRPIIMDGVRYDGLHPAARESDLCVSTVFRRLKSGRAKYADAA